jgi:putative proteasome-type protease
MTYCLGILSKEGVAGIADTRITSGTETTTAKKIYCVQNKFESYFIMTSGLRSVRDKAITYFDEYVRHHDPAWNKLYQVVNGFGQQIRKVAMEDRSSLEESGLQMNLYSIIGGQLEGDENPRLYLLYPQGNWIEISEASPYVIIGNTGFGNPILRRTLKYEKSLAEGLKSGFLSFDATRISACDVGFPLDTIICKKDTFNLLEQRLEEEDLLDMSRFWNDQIRETLGKLPRTKIDDLLDPHREIIKGVKSLDN